MQPVWWPPPWMHLVWYFLTFWNTRAVTTRGMSCWLVTVLQNKSPLRRHRVLWTKSWWQLIQFNIRTASALFYRHDGNGSNSSPPTSGRTEFEKNPSVFYGTPCTSTAVYNLLLRLTYVERKTNCHTHNRREMWSGLWFRSRIDHHIIVMQ